MMNIKSLLFHFCMLVSIWNSYGQCTCTVPSGVTGFANCIEVTSTIDDSYITASSACDGSLRWAILKANTLTGGTYIKFNIPGSSPHVINFKYRIRNEVTNPNNNFELVITSKVFIDGASQPDYDNVNKIPSVVLQGLKVFDVYAHGLRLGKGADGSIVKGLKITGYTEFGIIMDGTDPGGADNTTSPGSIQILDNIIYDVNSATYPLFSPSNREAAIGIFKCGNNSIITGNIIGANKTGTTVQATGAGLINGIYIMTRNYFVGSSYQYSSISNIQIGGNDNNLTLRNTIMNSGTGVNAISWYRSTPGEFTINRVWLSRNIFSGMTYKNFNLRYNTGGEAPPVYNIYANNNKPMVNIASCNETSISGTAEAGDVVEIFLSNSGGKDALVFLGSTTANGSGVWSLSRTSWTNSNILVEYGNIIVGTATNSTGNTSEFNLPYTSTCFCPLAKISGLPAVICKAGTPVVMTAIPSGGTFQGNGVTGNTFSPASVSPGVNLVNYVYSYPSLTCTTSQKVLIPKVMPAIDRVISATATTYSDAWPEDYTNLKVVQDVEQIPNVTLTLAGRNTLETSNEIANGTKGIWHGEETYTYVEKREQHVPVTIKEDGIFNNMPLFDHTSAVNAGCTPKWRLVNTITEYNLVSFDTENKDILNRYSAALFGYKADLPIAVAANAREREIAFESFEEYTAGAPIKPSNLTAGNLTAYTTTPVSGDFYKVYRPYEVIEATDNRLTVEIPLAIASGWNGKMVKVTGAGMNSYHDKEIYGSYSIISVVAHASDANKSIVTLSSTTFSYSGIWKGKLSIPTDYSSPLPVFSGTSNLSVVSTKKHTGKNSLKSTGNASFQQILIDLIPGEKYVLGAWVSTDQPNYTYRILSGVERRGFTVEFFNSTGTSLGTTQIDIEDKNPVIEGWQKIEGTFTYPSTASKMVLSFNTPAGVATYWDDIRLFPFNGNIQTYVYNKLNYKVSAVLDNNNYASLYYYDAQGNLFLVKKETEKGIQTIQESFSHQKE